MLNGLFWKEFFSKNPIYVKSVPMDLLPLDAIYISIILFPHRICGKLFTFPDVTGWNTFFSAYCSLLFQPIRFSRLILQSKRPLIRLVCKLYPNAPKDQIIYPLNSAFFICTVLSPSLLKGIIFHIFSELLLHFHSCLWTIHCIWRCMYGKRKAKQ